MLAAAAVVNAAPPAAKAARQPAAKALGHFTHGGEKTVLTKAHARWEKRYDDTLVIVVLLTEKPLSPGVAAAFAKGTDMQDVVTPIVESGSGALHFEVTPEGRLFPSVVRRPGLYSGTPRDAAGQLEHFKMAGGRVSGALKAAFDQPPAGAGDIAATFDAALPARPQPAAPGKQPDRHNPGGS
jgi:hypothetical protein